MRLSFLVLMVPVLFLFPSFPSLLLVFDFCFGKATTDQVFKHTSRIISGKNPDWRVNYWLDFLVFLEKLCLLSGRYLRALRFIELQWQLIPKSEPRYLINLIQVGHSLGKFEEVRGYTRALQAQNLSSNTFTYLKNLLDVGDSHDSTGQLPPCCSLAGQAAVLAGPGNVRAELVEESRYPFPILAHIINRCETTFFRPPALENLGFKTVLAYINGEYARQVDWDSIVLEQYGIDCLVFKKAGSPPKSGNYRSARFSSPLFGRGGPHLAQAIVLDLWFAGVAQIYATGIDFHLGEKVYSDIYKSGAHNLSVAEFRRSSARHNPFENWGVIGLFVWSGYLSGDPDFLRIATLEVTQFASELDRVWGEQLTESNFRD